MFYNGANCDIYIGKGAGKKLLSDIYNAKKSIKVVSPYLSPFLIKELINLRKRNIEVELITTDTIEDFYGSYEKNIHELIIQNKTTDNEAIKIRERWKEILKILLYTTIGFFIVIVVLAYFLMDMKVAFGLIPLGVLFLMYKLLDRKVKNKRIYNYRYSQIFPFKVYMSPDSTDESDTFIHGKIYLIDDEIAYLGSLNFTTSGTKHNYETRIRTTDANAIKEINKEVFRLMNHSCLPEKDIQLWGKQLYPEPIN